MPRLNDESKLGQEIMTLETVSGEWGLNFRPEWSYDREWLALIAGRADALRASLGPSKVTIKWGARGFDASFTDPGLPLSLEARLFSPSTGEWYWAAVSHNINILSRKVHEHLMHLPVVQIGGVDEDRLSLYLNYSVSLRLKEPLDQQLSKALWAISKMREEEAEEISWRSVL
jgi:hypothetical protein